MHCTHKHTQWMHKQAEAVKLNGIAQSLPPPIPASLSLSLSKPPNPSLSLPPSFSSSEEFINCLSTETLWKSGSYKGRGGRVRGRGEGWAVVTVVNGGLYYPIRCWICLLSLPCHEKNINFKWETRGRQRGWGCGGDGEGGEGRPVRLFNIALLSSWNRESPGSIYLGSEDRAALHECHLKCHGD